MKVVFCSLADFASGAERGKLNVLGIFDTIWSKSFPATHQSMTLVIRLLAEYEDSESKHKVGLRLMGPNGAALMETTADMNVGTMEVGAFSHMNVIMQLNMVKFPGSGTYKFVVTIDTTLAAEALLRVAQGIR